MAENNLGPLIFLPGKGTGKIYPTTFLPASILPPEFLPILLDYENETLLALAGMSAFPRRCLEQRWYVSAMQPPRRPQLNARRPGNLSTALRIGSV